LDDRALEPLTRAPTLRTASILLDQYHGAFARAVDADPVPLADLARYALLGRHLVTPWKVVVAGPPNVGKSSLVNALAGYQRTVVAPVPGTTRDVVTTAVAFDGWPVELADTAGLREATENLEAEGVGRARRLLAGADLVVWVMDLTDPNPIRPDAGTNPLVVANKSDQPPRWSPVPADLVVSAATGAGVPGLAAAIARRLVPIAPLPGAAVPFTPALADAIEQAVTAGATGRPPG
jgi:tRNA modification GTPase